jgi:hypothetical protein
MSSVTNTSSRTLTVTAQLKQRVNVRKARKSQFKVFLLVFNVEKQNTRWEEGLDHDSKVDSQCAERADSAMLFSNLLLFIKSNSSNW